MHIATLLIHIYISCLGFGCLRQNVLTCSEFKAIINETDRKTVSFIKNCLNYTPSVRPKLSKTTICGLNFRVCNSDCRVFPIHPLAQTAPGYFANSTGKQKF